jgi:glycosyltransferase involved in cell wall biosynthesis
MSKLVNAVTLSASMFVAALRRFRRGDVVLVVTNPPVLPFVITAAARMRRARTVLIVHDVYPEVLTRAGLVAPRSLAARCAGRLTAALYAAVDRIVVLGRDMRALAQAKTPGGDEKIVLIPNWADLHEVTPSRTSGHAVLERLGLSGKFVAQYAGNMGRTHDLESIAEAARALSANPRFHFLLIGGGAKAPLVERAVVDYRLCNVTLAGQRPRSEQQAFLNACDVTLITFVPGMAGVSVPSRMYNVMAAGKPIIAMAEADSELARMVLEHDIGWVVPPGDSAGLIAALRDAEARPDRLAAMGQRARRLVESAYTLEHAVSSYRELVASEVLR